MSDPYPMSDKHRRNVLETFGTALRWGVGDGRRLPSEFRMPNIADVVGKRVKKDMFRKPTWPLERRLQLVHSADRFALTTFATQLILPPRPEQVAGLLTSEIDWQRRALRFGDRFNGGDFTKGRTSWWLPFPRALEPILRAAAAGRTAGPLFLKRSIVETGATPEMAFEGPTELAGAVETAISQERHRAPLTDNDAKQVSRSIIARAGGITEDQLRREFLALAEGAGCIGEVRYYDLRSAVLTEYKKVGIPREIRAYLAGHDEGSGSALEAYECYDLDDLHEQIRPHWKFAQRLIDAVVERARRLGV